MITIIYYLSFNNLIHVILMTAIFMISNFVINTIDKVLSNLIKMI